MTSLTTHYGAIAESSLDGLDTFVVGISSQISTLDEEISKAVQAQSVAGKQASKVIFQIYVLLNKLVYNSCV
jgi:hypothetical protein